MDLIVDKAELDGESSVGKQLKDESGDSGAGTPAAGTPATTPATAAPSTPATPAATPGTPAGTPATAAVPAAGTSASTEPVKVDEVEKAVLEQIFGRSVSKDEAKRIVGEFPNITKEYEQLKANTPKFANDYVKGLNDYLAKGGDADTYNKIQALDIDKLEGLAAIKARYKWEHPQLTDTQIDRKLGKLYNQGEDATPEEKEDGLIDITIDSKKAKEELLKIKQEKSIPDTERLRIKGESDERTRLESWKPQTVNLVKELNSFDIPIAVDGAGKPTDIFKFSDISEDMRKDLLQEVNLIVERSGISFAQESLPIIKDVVHERFLVKNFGKIVQALATEFETRATKKANEEYRNGNIPPKGDISPSGSKTNEDALFERDMNYVTGK